MTNNEIQTFLDADGFCVHCGQGNYPGETTLYFHCVTPFGFIARCERCGDGTQWIISADGSIAPHYKASQ
jgi:hypothetical protein